MSAGNLPDPAELRTLVARLRQESEVIRGEAEGSRDSVREQLAQSRAERDEALRGLARAARDGELGSPARRLARRVDDGETSWLDVLHERDASPEAAALRYEAAVSVSALVEELADQDPDLRRTTGRDQGGSSRGHQT
ncbi:MAG: hypothetical protein ACXWW7_16895 [Nocardioides sp.]